MHQFIATNATLGRGDGPASFHFATKFFATIATFATNATWNATNATIYLAFVTWKRKQFLPMQLTNATWNATFVTNATLGLLANAT